MTNKLASVLGCFVGVALALSFAYPRTSPQVPPLATSSNRFLVFVPVAQFLKGDVRSEAARCLSEAGIHSILSGSMIVTLYAKDGDQFRATQMLRSLPRVRDLVLDPNSTSVESLLIRPNAIAR